MASLVPDVPYTCEGRQHPVTLVLPNWDQAGGVNPKNPLIVFLQGSAWTSPNRGYQLPQLCRYAQQGFAVATISHRNCLEGNPFPAYLKDAKAAIRFLRSQADAFGLDPDRVGFFGTSSGGNTALLVGLTGDDPRYRTEDYPEESDAVQAVADCFGPADLLAMGRDSAPGNGEHMEHMLSLIGGRDAVSVLREMSPFHHVKDGAAYPPFLLSHGDADPLVPYSQSELMHRRLKEAGAISLLIRVRGAEHEGTFWSGELHGLILDHFRKYL